MIKKDNYQYIYLNTYLSIHISSNSSIRFIYLFRKVMKIIQKGEPAKEEDNETKIFFFSIF